MKVVFATELFFPWLRGGAEVSILELAKGVAKKGVDVAIVTPLLGEQPERLDLPKNVELVRFKLPLFKARGADTPFHAFNHPLFFARFARAIKEKALSMSADIIHACNYYSYMAALRAARDLKLKVVATTRDYRLVCPAAWCIVKNDIPESCGYFKLYGCLKEFWSLHEKGALEPWPRFFLRHLYERFFLSFHRRAFLKMDAVNFVSRGQREIYEKFGIVHPRAAVLYNPVELPNIEDIHVDAGDFKNRHSLQGKQIILFVGRFSIGKGARALLDAYSKLRAMKRDIALVVLGSNGLGSEVDKFREQGLIMMGRVSRDEVLRWYSVSDVVVVPSVWAEPYGRVVVEAQTLGKPVVASDAGGTSEHIKDGVNGLLVPAGNVEALASGIARVLSDNKLAKNLGAEAKKISEFRSPEKIAEEFLGWYRSVLEKA